MATTVRGSAPRGAKALGFERWIVGKVCVCVYLVCVCVYLVCACVPGVCVCVLIAFQTRVCRARCCFIGSRSSPVLFLAAPLQWCSDALVRFPPQAGLSPSHPPTALPCSDPPSRLQTVENQQNHNLKAALL